MKQHLVNAHILTLVFFHALYSMESQLSLSQVLSLRQLAAQKVADMLINNDLDDVRPELAHYSRIIPAESLDIIRKAVVQKYPTIALTWTKKARDLRGDASRRAICGNAVKRLLDEGGYYNEQGTRNVIRSMVEGESIWRLKDCDDNVEYHFALPCESKPKWSPDGSTLAILMNNHILFAKRDRYRLEKSKAIGSAVSSCWSSDSSIFSVVNWRDALLELYHLKKLSVEGWKICSSTGLNNCTPNEIETPIHDNSGHVMVDNDFNTYRDLLWTTHNDYLLARSEKKIALYDTLTGKRVYTTNLNNGDDTYSLLCRESHAENKHNHIAILANDGILYVHNFEKADPVLRIDTKFNPRGVCYMDGINAWAVISKHATKENAVESVIKYYDEQTGNLVDTFQYVRPERDANKSHPLPIRNFTWEDATKKFHIECACDALLTYETDICSQGLWHLYQRIQQEK